jgi:hypothetical protein
MVDESTHVLQIWKKLGYRDKNLTEFILMASAPPDSQRERLKGSSMTAVQQPPVNK